MGNAVITVALGPLLLLQGRRVRRTTQVLPEPPGERQGQLGEGKPLRLLILGDSAAAGVGADHQTEALSGQLSATLGERYKLSWRLWARSGATTASALRSLDKISGESFDVAITSLGVNDVTAGMAPRRCLQQQHDLRRRLAEQFGVRLVVCSGLPPVEGFPALPQPLRWYLGRRARQFDRLLEQSVKDDQLSRFLSLRFTNDTSRMAADGFHPGPAIYEEWARRASAIICLDPEFS